MMKLKKLGSQFSAYVQRSARNREDLYLVLDEIKEHLPQTVVFGGMLRDFALGYANSFDSDIDLVSEAPPELIEFFLRNLTLEKNKFGGFRFVYGNYRFDIWSLADTWAFKNQKVQFLGFESLLHTTFFNFDAIYLPLWDSGKSVKFHPQYATWIKQRVLDINLVDNPSPSGMAKRVLASVIDKDLAISRRLVSYTLEHADIRSSNNLESSILLSMRMFMESSTSASFVFRPQQQLMI